MRRFDRRSASRREFNGAWLSAAFATINIKSAIHLDAALRSYAGERLSLCRRIGCEPDGEASAIGLASLLIKELRGLEIAIPFGDISAVIQRERIGGVQSIGLHEIAPRRGPVVFILGRNSLLAEQ